MPGAYLEIIRGGDVEVVQLDEDRLTLGRSQQCTLAFPDDDAMSRSHAVLERDDAGWLVRDAGSSNGTYVNGAKLQSDQRLRPGDRVSLGDTRLVSMPTSRPRR